MMSWQRIVVVVTLVLAIAAAADAGVLSYARRRANLPATADTTRFESLAAVRTALKPAGAWLFPAGEGRMTFNARMKQKTFTVALGDGAWVLFTEHVGAANPDVGFLQNKDAAIRAADVPATLYQHSEGVNSFVNPQHAPALVSKGLITGAATFSNHRLPSQQDKVLAGDRRLNGRDDGVRTVEDMDTHAAIKAGETGVFPAWVRPLEQAASRLLAAFAGTETMSVLFEGALEAGVDVGEFMRLYVKPIVQVYPAGAAVKAHSHGKGVGEYDHPDQDVVFLLRFSPAISGNAVRAGSEGPVFGVSSGLCAGYGMNAVGTGVQRWENPDAEQHSKALGIFQHSPVAPPADGMYSFDNAGSVGGGEVLTITLFARSSYLAPHAMRTLLYNWGTKVFADAGVRMRVARAHLAWANEMTLDLLQRQLPPLSGFRVSMSFRSHWKERSDVSERASKCGGGHLQYNGAILMAVQDGDKAYLEATIEEQKELNEQRKAAGGWLPSLGKNAWALPFFEAVGDQIVEWVVEGLDAQHIVQRLVAESENGRELAALIANAPSYATVGEFVEGYGTVEPDNYPVVD